MKTKSIYIVTTIQFGHMYLDKKRSPDGAFHSWRCRTSKGQRRYYGIVDKRTWGWYSDLDHAKRALKENYSDMYEGNYTYAVIEKFNEGILDYGFEGWWFKWKGSWKKGRYKSANKPRRYKGVIAYGMG